MGSGRTLILLVNVLLVQNIYGQCLPLGGCGCQQIPVPQSLPVQNYQVGSGCGCARNLPLANLPNGIQFTNTLQIAKSLQNVPCGCVPNNVPLQNSLQFANYGSPQLSGLQMANLPLSQNDLLALMNGIPIPNSQNVLQLSMQALLNQLGGGLAGGQCGCQSTLAQNGANSFLNANNLNLLNGYAKPFGLPGQPCSNVLSGVPVAGTQEIVLNNAPCPCQSCQNPNSMSFSLY